VLERLQRVRREVATEPSILERQAALLSLARLAAGVVYDATSPAPVLGGKATWIDRETLELTYAFDAASDLDDWSSKWKSWRDKLQTITVPQPDWESRQGDGVWSLLGSFLLRHALPFDAPLNVQVTLRHGGSVSDVAGLGIFMVGTCDQGEGDCAGAGAVGEVFVYDSKSGKSVFATPPTLYAADLGEEVVLELTHDGGTLRPVLQGKAVPAQSTGTLRSGGIFLLVHTSRTIALDSIRIRGKLGPDARKLLRERWIAREVAATGLE
jgi:hypothetical protein